MSTKGCASDTALRNTTFRVYGCPVDGRPCEVLEPLRKRLSGEVQPDAYGELVDSLADSLPCQDCRKGEAEARNLVGGGVRLGKNERRILLASPLSSKCGARDEVASPTYPADGLIAWPSGPGRAAEEAHRRAARKLERLALIELSKSPTDPTDNRPPKWARLQALRSRYWMMGRRRLAARLTSLGEALVEAYRTELESGRPIRWEKHRARLVSSVRRPVSELLGLLSRCGVERGLFFAGFAASAGSGQDRKVDILKRARAAILAIRAGESS